MLSRKNVMYQQKRLDGSLGPVRIQRLRRGTWNDYCERMGRERATGDSQFKLPPLMPGVGLQCLREIVGVDKLGRRLLTCSRSRFAFAMTESGVKKID